jgi:SAM-dependent methyltransferase
MAASRRSSPVFARLYRWVSPLMERAGMTAHRRDLLAGLAGRVVEVGAGNGLLFAHYPPGVTSVLAIEPEPSLRAAAVLAAVDAPVPVRVSDGTAERIDVPDGAFDAAVTCLVLCSVADQASALREIHRVVRPGGELRVLEHVRAATPALRGVQRACDATVWPAIAGGCHTGRDTAAAVEAAGFSFTRRRHLDFPGGPIRLPTSPHVIGVARRNR